MNDFNRYEAILKNLEERIGRLERDAANEKNVRYAMVRFMASYLMSADPDGDYCEFGVGEGRIFSYVIRALAPQWPSMNFWGYDTFSGMPEPKGLDKNPGFRTGYCHGQFSCRKSEVEHFCLSQNRKIDPKRIRLVEGNFSETLIGNGPHPDKISAAFIDAIYKDSVAMVLDFLTPRIDVGTLLIFDDWHGMRNLPHLGSQGAFSEWIGRTGIRVVPCFPFGGIGQGFTILSRGSDHE